MRKVYDFPARELSEFEKRAKSIVEGQKDLDIKCFMDMVGAELSRLQSHIELLTDRICQMEKRELSYLKKGRR